MSDVGGRIFAEIEKAQTLAEVTDIRNKISPLQDYYRQSRMGLEKVNELAEAKVEAECKGGDILRGLERDQGGRPQKNSLDNLKSFSPYRTEINAAGLNDFTAHRWQTMAWAPRAKRLEYYAKQRDVGRTITSEDVYRLGKKAMPHEVDEPTQIEGKYSVIVIDPPWPMQRIERDVAPNQAGFDYPTMSEDEIAQLGTGNDDVVPNMMEDDCHIFLWTTQKFIPMARRLFEKWDIKYVLEMVWHKPGGFQPFGLPQYNCEFVLYGRKGAPQFTETKDFFCCFNAPRQEHSRKPDEFYDTIKRVTAGARIEVFAREPRDGYDAWGNQTKKFSEDAA